MVYPFISIILPCRNEELFIENCLNSILSNDYDPDKTEIFAIDGLSTDNTLSILNGFANKYSNIRIQKNSKMSFPAAVNIGIEMASGDLIFILGAHAVYEKSYLRKCVEYSLKYGADNVGGVLQTVPDSNNILGRLITLILSNPFGVGNSKFRTGSEDILETDTVFGGCYKKEVFTRYGLFNEELISTSDYEFNRRIKRYGARIILIPEIKVTYFTRSSLLKFIKNNLRNGFWALYPIALTDHFPVSIRHLVPLVFFLSLVLSLLLSAIWNIFFQFFFIILLIYFLASLWFSLKVKFDPRVYVVFLPMLFLVLHISYGLGSLYGLLKAGLHKALSGKSVLLLLLLRLKVYVY